MSINITPDPNRRLSVREATLDGVARYLGVGTRTVRNYLAEGYFGAYQVEGQRGLIFDLDEVDEARKRLPSYKMRAAHGSYGPKAVIRRAPRRVRAVVVESE